MVSRTEAGASWASIAACALIAALVPAGRTAMSAPTSIGLLALVWAGAVSCSALTYSTSSGTTISLLPCIMAYMALRRPPWTVEAAFVAGCIVGYSVMEIRQRRSTSPSLASVLEHSLQAWASLRLVTAARSLLPASRYESYWMVLLLMVAGVTAAVLLQRHLRILFRPPRSASLWVMLRQTGEMVGVPALFTPLLVPGRIDSVEVGGLTAAGFTALVIAQIALYLALDRSRHSVGRSRAASRALSLLTEGLSRASTPLEALRGLSSALRHSPGYRWLRLDWGAISLVSPPHKSGDAGAPLVFGAGARLEARVVPPREGLDSRRLRSFLSHTRTALQNLELRRSASMEAWTTMETMVYSLDRADRRLAGHSKDVAEVALELGRSLKLSSAMLDNLRMAALLHHIAPTVLQEQRGGMGGFTLPRPTVETLSHMSENVDGSGRPDGLKGNTIPLLSRILRVADDYVTERERSGPDEAMAALRQRAGSIYDASLVSMVVSTD